MTTTKTALLASLFAGLVACGGEAPTTDTPDTGIDTTVDANTAVDADSGVQTSPDNGTVTPDGGVTPDAPATSVCIPSSSNRTCSGFTCRPAPANPTCEGADSCSCAMGESDMDPTICTAATMPSCNAAVTCSPGRNHCSVNLPDSIDFARFTDFDPGSNSRGGLRETILTEWRFTDRNAGLQFTPLSGVSARGFVRTCFHLPANAAVPSNLSGTEVCADCSGLTCYWNRGRMSNSLPSVEIEFQAGNDACTFQFRLYAAGGNEPVLTNDLFSTNGVCNR